MEKTHDGRAKAVESKLANIACVLLDERAPLLEVEGWVGNKLSSGSVGVANTRVAVKEHGGPPPGRSGVPGTGDLDDRAGAGGARPDDVLDHHD